MTSPLSRPAPAGFEPFPPAPSTHVCGEPAILYFGTPVVLVSTRNADGSANLAPISSVFWLGWRCVIGVSGAAQTSANLRREGECVLNLPSAGQVDAVNALALTTGVDPVPGYKAKRGYRHEGDKFARAGLTQGAAETVGAPRALECPVQLEAKLAASHAVAADDPRQNGAILTFELRVTRVHLAREILLDDQPNRVDPDKWRPLVMSFQRFYGLGGELASSRLASIPESHYRSPDVDRARAEAEPGP